MSQEHCSVTDSQTDNRFSTPMHGYARYYVCHPSSSLSINFTINHIKESITTVNLSES